MHGTTLDLRYAGKVPMEGPEPCSIAVDAAHGVGGAGFTIGQIPLGRQPFNIMQIGMY